MMEGFLSDLGRDVGRDVKGTAKVAGLAAGGGALLALGASAGTVGIALGAIYVLKKLLNARRKGQERRQQEWGQADQERSLLEEMAAQIEALTKKVEALGHNFKSPDFYPQGQAPVRGLGNPMSGQGFLFGHQKEQLNQLGGAASNVLQHFEKSPGSPDGGAANTLEFYDDSARFLQEQRAHAAALGDKERCKALDRLEGKVNRYEQLSGQEVAELKNCATAAKDYATRQTDLDQRFTRGEIVGRNIAPDIQANRDRFVQARHMADSELEVPRSTSKYGTVASQSRSERAPTGPETASGGRVVPEGRARGGAPVANRVKVPTKQLDREVNPTNPRQQGPARPVTPTPDRQAPQPKVTQQAPQLTR